MTKETLAARLKELREAAGLTQIELSQKAGLKPFKVRDIEQGKAGAKWEDIEAIADALGVSIGTFREASLEPQEKAGPGRPPKRSAGPFSFSLVGYAAAGSGSLEEFPEGATISLHDVCNGCEGCVTYQVKGDSMIEDHIKDGDYIIVRESPEAKPGDVVVAWLRDEGAVIKKMGKGNLLRSRDRSGWTHQMRPEDRLLGVLVGVIRRC